ncbi:MAG: hypothetical protein KKC71_12415, partial [Chloroflexi bacterium]|nr:hypothetical protein [Chloroflexota bacterium]
MNREGAKNAKKTFIKSLRGLRFFAVQIHNPATQLNRETIRLSSKGEMFRGEGGKAAPASGLLRNHPLNLNEYDLRAFGHVNEVAGSDDAIHAFDEIVHLHSEQVGS